MNLNQYCIFLLDVIQIVVYFLQSDSQVHIHWKGAAEIVLDSCTKYVDASGKTVPLDQDKVGLDGCFL